MAYPTWPQEVGFDFPGYNNGILLFKHIENKNDQYTINFLASPTDFSVSKQSLNSEQQTLGGRIVQQFGPMPEQIQIAGILFDSQNVQEALMFLYNFKKLMTPMPNMLNEYSYKYSQYIRIEGIEYYGQLQSLNLTKSGIKPFYYSFSLTFVALTSTIIDPFSFKSARARLITSNGTTTPDNYNDPYSNTRPLTFRFRHDTF